MLFVMFVVVSITFFLIRLAPGGPFDSERKLPAEIERALLKKYKLDGPLWEQYLYYLRDVVRGDLRLSTKYRNRSVNELLAQTLPLTMGLGLTAFLLVVTGGVTLGVISAWKYGGLMDALAMFFALLAISLPSFVLGPILILVFSFWLGWLPVGGWGELQHLVLPAITLALPYMAYVARLTRAGMLDALEMEFVRTGRAKGLSDAVIVWKHAMRVGLLPVVSYLGPLAAHLLTGSIVVETLFNIPGAGGFFVYSVLNRDGFLLGGVVIVYCGLLVVFNALVDLILRILDPRISSDERI
ncbi:MAG: ABC transporter permease [Chthoniobacterales bacterium]|nr:ABC transporter permease [Chthoniobacterales bacterium]